jgi:hypothetical protein
MKKLIFIATLGLLISCSDNSAEKEQEQKKLEEQQRVTDAELKAKMERKFQKQRDVDAERLTKDKLERERLKSSTVIIGDLEVMTEDIKLTNWGQAVNYAGKIGDGWRLPTLKELNILHENQETIGGFHTVGVYANYWSSLEFEGPGYKAWLQCFNKENHHSLRQDGVQYYTDKSNSQYHVRLVRDAGPSEEKLHQISDNNNTIDIEGFPADFIEFINSFSSNSSYQLEHIKFPLLNGGYDKPAPSKDKWVFLDKNSIYEGLKDFNEGEYIGQFYLENKNKIEYMWGLADSEAEFKLFFVKDETGWNLEEYSDNTMWGAL